MVYCSCKVRQEIFFLVHNRHLSFIHTLKQDTVRCDTIFLFPVKVFGLPVVLFLLLVYLWYICSAKCLRQPLHTAVIFFMISKTYLKCSYRVVNVSLLTIRSGNNVHSVLTCCAAYTLPSGMKEITMLKNLPLVLPQVLSNPFWRHHL